MIICVCVSHTFQVMDKQGELQTGQMSIWDDESISK